MNSRERFIATVERKPVDRPACWLGDPTPEAVPALCDYYHVDNIKELKKGKAIQMPVYDYTIHNRSDKTILVEPAPVIVLELSLIHI